MGTLPLKAHAQEDFQRTLDAAVRLYMALEYEQALAQLQKARWSARNDGQEVSVSLHEGIFLGDSGQREQSRAAFTKALRKNPQARLPFKVSPKLERDFEEIRAQVLQEPRGLNSVTPPVVGKSGPPLLNPPTPMVSEPFAPATKALGNRVPVTPLVLAGAGVAAAGVGALFGMRSHSSINDARGATFQDETRAHLDDARGRARVANVLFGTAGLAATGALVTWLLSADGGPTPAPKETP